MKDLSPFLEHSAEARRMPQQDVEHFEGQPIHEGDDVQEKLRGIHESLSEASAIGEQGHEDPKKIVSHAQFEHEQTKTLSFFDKLKQRFRLRYSGDVQDVEERRNQQRFHGSQSGGGGQS